ncbi:Lysine-specific demethylase 7B [Phytophthora cinnamomi]|uniref:Lysine-specific demethylase 7B n=1 Tax=Phytophthora cinnamomi TaxID=4785 RepID=UPI00355A0FF7|nr:Lysine-specific demethylase 7B [Phytophthora cinnamomi]
MEAAAVESISKALGLPRPFLHEPNRAFTQLETWQQLTALLATQPVRIKPLGYYRTPDSVDIYVFECTLGDAGRYSWKIYRRYRHFQKYIAHSSELLASRSVRVPRLSQAYLKIFHAQHCKDRLVELHKWLEGVAENTQSYCLQLQHKQEQQEREKLLALQQQRLAQLEQQARLKAARKQHKTHSSSNATAARPDVPTTSMSTGRLRAPSTTASSRRRSSISLKTVEQQGDPALYVLRTDKAEALPVVMLSCFLFAGANCPFPHVFRGMPTFALAMEELNVQLTQAAPAAYPSKLKNSMTSRAGLGLRLTASHEQEGQFLGATVAGFLRDQQELDPALADVPVGAKLVRVNGVNVSDAPFDQVLVQLREAQTDLSNSLQLALMENASIRDEIGVLQDAHRELRLAQERAAQRELILQAKIEQSDVIIAKLNEEVDVQRQELEKSRLRAQEAEATLATNKREYQAMLEKAQESAKTRLAEHEEQLVKESNRSIENANRMAERRAQKMLESAENESQRKHEEYLQKLAEEHSEEVESLMQQVAVWRHQVEVLTEAEKRNYAALVSNGVNPYGDYQRSRFGYSSSDSPFADLKSGGSSDLQAPRRKPGKAQESSVSTAATAAKWRDGSPEDDKHKGHAFSGTSDQSSQSNNGTFWDRMVSLLATE